MAADLWSVETIKLCMAMDFLKCRWESEGSQQGKRLTGRCLHRYKYVYLPFLNRSCHVTNFT